MKSSWWIDEEPYPGPQEKFPRQEFYDRLKKNPSRPHQYGLAFDIPASMRPTSAMRSPDIRHVDFRHTSPPSIPRVNFPHHPYYYYSRRPCP